MTEEDLLRVDHILNGKEVDPNTKSTHESLGIHNVNQRIKLIYGKEYGLTIMAAGNGQTASTITIPYEQMQNEINEKARNNIWNKLE
jgi:two-component system sensor histidine kinase YesM